MLKLLFENQDLAYKDFQAKLVPTVPPDNMIGIRVPVLRKIAKELYGSKDCAKFMQSLPHRYHEENSLHAFFIEQIKDFDACVAELDAFLPYVDNWATCDSLRPKCFSKNADKLLLQITKWLNSDHTYTVRFAIEMLMVHFLDERFDKAYPEMICKIKSDEYYINMMIAWYFATALAKQWDCIFPYLEERRLPDWVHKKTISKACESYRITAEQKTILKELRTI